MQLLREWPGASAQHDPDGCLPLHVAVQCFASQAVLRALLDAHPDAIKDADPDDLMPLHVAIEQQATSLPRQPSSRPPPPPAPADHATPNLSLSRRLRTR